MWKTNTSIKFEKNTLDEVDSIAENSPLYDSRSNFIRVAVRKLVEEESEYSDAI